MSLLRLDPNRSRRFYFRDFSREILSAKTWLCRMSLYAKLPQENVDQSDPTHLDTWVPIIISKCENLTPKVADMVSSRFLTGLSLRLCNMAHYSFSQLEQKKNDSDVNVTGSHSRFSTHRALAVLTSLLGFPHPRYQCASRVIQHA